MAVPARPVEGAPVDVTWGGVAHDAAVAQDFQYGQLVVPANAGSANVTFARPFASAPIVVIVPQTASRNYFGTTNAPTTTGFGIVAAQLASGSLPIVPTTVLTFGWFAIGPRA